MLCRSTHPRIVIKSLFPILTLFKKNNKPHIFDPPLPEVAEDRKYGVCCFFRFFMWFMNIFMITKTTIFLRVWSNYSTARWKIKNLSDRNLCFRVLNKLLELFLQVMFSCMGGDESAETSNNDVGKLISRLKPMPGVVTNSWISVNQIKN